MNYRTLSAILGCCVVISSAGQAESTAPQSIAELESAIEAVLKQNHTPGAAVTIVAADQVEWTGTFGLADAQAKREMTPHTVFRLGSLSKSFVGLAVLKLQEEGKLHLTDPVAQWLPELAIENPWNATDPVRLAHLLEHTSGLPDLRFSEYARGADRRLGPLSALKAAVPHRKVRWKPGSRFSYSSVGYAVAAAVIEKAAKQRFEDYIHREFLAPLEMQSASYERIDTSDFPFTQMYWSSGDRVAPYTEFLYPSAGGLNGSVTDLGNYLRFFLQRGRFGEQHVLSEASLNRFEIPQTLPAISSGVQAGYGLGIKSIFLRGYEWHAHDGEWDGCLSALAYCPELGCGVAVLLNARNYTSLRPISQLVLDYAMRGIADAPLPAPFTLSDSDSRALNGYYENVAPRDEGARDFTEYFRSVSVVRADEVGLTLQRALGGPEQRWIAISARLFRPSQAGKAALARLNDEPGGMALQTPEATFQRISGPRFWFIVRGLQTSVVLLATCPLFAMVWIPRCAWGKLKKQGAIAIRLGPLTGSLALFGMAIFYATVQEGSLHILGTLNVWTAAFFSASLILPASAGYALVALWRYRYAPINRLMYGYSMVATVALIFLTAFCWAWDLIGVRLWV